MPTPESQRDGEAGVSKEVERAIRNMSGLTRPRRRDAAGGRPVDPARDLAEKVGDENALAAKIWERMNIHKRTRRELRFADADAEAEPLRWLQDNFQHVNNGRHPEFSLPKRIDVTVPSRILYAETLSISIVDTKGIDGVAERGDLETHLNEPNTVAVLCTSFNNAPAVSVQQLLERAVKASFPDLETKSAMLVLAHSGEALGMKYDDGDLADTVSEGYDLKRDAD